MSKKDHRAVAVRVAGVLAKTIVSHDTLSTALKKAGLEDTPASRRAIWDALKLHPRLRDQGYEKKFFDGKEPATPAVAHRDNPGAGAHQVDEALTVALSVLHEADELLKRLQHEAGARHDADTSRVDALAEQVAAFEARIVEVGESIPTTDPETAGKLATALSQLQELELRVNSFSDIAAQQAASDALAVAKEARQCAQAGDEHAQLALAAVVECENKLSAGSTLLSSLRESVAALSSEFSAMKEDSAKPLVVEGAAEAEAACKHVQELAAELQSTLSGMQGQQEVLSGELAASRTQVAASEAAARELQQAINAAKSTAQQLRQAESSARKAKASEESATAAAASVVKESEALRAQLKEPSSDLRVNKNIAAFNSLLFLGSLLAMAVTIYFAVFYKG